MRKMEQVILSAHYIISVGTHKEIGLDEEFSGDCDTTLKTIRVATDKLVDCDGSVERTIETMKLTLRHELCHAFLYESGMKQYYDDETLIGWLEVMLPKLVRCEELGLKAFDNFRI